MKPSQNMKMMSHSSGEKRKFFFALALCAAFAYAAPTQTPENLSFIVTLRKQYAALGIDTALVSSKKRADYLDEEVKVPKSLPLVEAAAELWQFLSVSGVTALDAYEKEKSKSIVFTFRDPASISRRIVLSYSPAHSDFLLGIVWSLPDTAFTGLIQRAMALSPCFGYLTAPENLVTLCSQIGGKGEILVRLPMEQPGGRRNGDKIFLQSPKNAVREAMGFFNAPECRPLGVAPPFQSVVLGDRRIMNIVLDETKRRKAYFFEIKPMRNSVSAGLSREKGVGYFACREVINAVNPETALAQVRRLIVIADKTGDAIAIASLTPAVLSAMENARKELEMHGISFCLPSRLSSIQE